MNFKCGVLSLLMLMSALAIAEERPDCGAAVDAADRLAPSADEHCDYTKTGLNGVLHKAFSGTKVAEEGSASSVQTRAEQAKNVVANPLIARAEFNSPQQLQAVKFSLLEVAASKCNQGFVMETEQYLPAASKAMMLELSYRCL